VEHALQEGVVNRTEVVVNVECVGVHGVDVIGFGVLHVDQLGVLVVLEVAVDFVAVVFEHGVQRGVLDVILVAQGFDGVGADHLTPGDHGVGAGHQHVHAGLELVAVHGQLLHGGLLGRDLLLHVLESAAHHVMLHEVVLDCRLEARVAVQGVGVLTDDHAPRERDQREDDEEDHGQQQNHPLVARELPVVLDDVLFVQVFDLVVAAPNLFLGLLNFTFQILVFVLQFPLFIVSSVFNGVSVRVLDDFGLQLLHFVFGVETHVDLAVELAVFLPTECTEVHVVVVPVVFGEEFQSELGVETLYQFGEHKLDVARLLSLVVHVLALVGFLLELFARVQVFDFIHIYRVALRVFLVDDHSGNEFLHFVEVLLVIKHHDAALHEVVLRFVFHIGVEVVFVVVAHTELVVGLLLLVFGFN